MTDEYIKMILALPAEFFEDWEWQAGDRAITLTSHREIMIISTPLRLKLVKMMNPQNGGWIEAIFPESDDITHEMFKISDLRPVPRQEQLQDIIKSNFKNNGLVFEDRRENLYLEWRFEAWLRDQIFEEKTGLSFKCLWLGFLMEAVYEKRWNGDSWI